MNRLTTRASAAAAAALLAVLTSLGTSLAPATADSGPSHGSDDHGHGNGNGNGGNGHGDNNGQGHGNSHLAAIPLPTGFNPEDITNGPHHTFYVGSLATGGIFQGNYRSTTGSMLVAASPVLPGDTTGGGPTTGLYLQQRHGHDWLWAAGGPTGRARVYDATTGALVKMWQLAPASTPAAPTFISDVITTKDKAYYTDAFAQRLYVIDLATGVASTVPLTGDVHYLPQQGNGTFNLNGLALFRHGMLVSAQTATGSLYAIDPTTGKTTLIPLTGKRSGAAASIPGADGIAQRGNTLYIAQNFVSTIATVKINSHLTGARLIAQVTKTQNPALDVPSSVEEDRGNLWALNARFGTASASDQAFSIVRVDKH